MSSIYESLMNSLTEEVEDIKKYGKSQGRKTVLEVKEPVNKTFEEQLAEFNGEITVCDFDWGEPVGKEIL